MKKPIELSKDQCTAIGERIEELLDNTEDWQLEDQEYRTAVEYWLTILNILGQDKKATRIREHLLETQ